MTDIRPVDLPELRAEILAHYEHPIVVQWWSQRPALPALTVRDEDTALKAVLNPNGDQRRQNEIQRLQEADLYFVSAQMTEVAVAAAASLPSFDLAAEDLPSLSGFVIFEKPIAVDRNEQAGHGEEIFISGASWNLGAAGRFGVALWFSFYVDVYRTFDAEVAGGTMSRDEAVRQKGSQPRFSYTMDAAHLIGAGIPLNDDSVLNSWGRTILASWLLMQQPLAEVSSTEPPRAAVKRLRRAGHEPQPVRVIELRRPKTSGGTGEGTREYQHQWIVRGHWRQQWYPKRQVHRPVWIAPHVKGPEGAPMIGGEKVNVWKR